MSATLRVWVTTYAIWLSRVLARVTAGRSSQIAQDMAIGKTARDMYLTMIDHGWINRVDHACYVGKELTKAELSIRHGFAYMQDGA